MKALDELVAAALVGTQRSGAARLPTLPTELQSVLPPVESADAQLLDAAAACTTFARCGVMASSLPLNAPACESDVTAECSAKAADILERLFAENNEGLLSEWLTKAAQVQRRPPHRLIPQLLNWAARNRDIRDAVHAVIDRRGHWLASLNPHWQFARGPASDANSTWQTGSRDERLAVLKAVRADDPKRACAMVSETWSADGADDRVKWLDALSIELSDADEPFLETCLDDRGSRVRAAAADILSRLPDSRLVSRMKERLEPLLTFKKTLLGNPKSLDVALPDAFDKTMLRDAIVEKPAEKIGQKQWWLTQMLRCVPPTHWTARFGITPNELINVIEKDYRGLFVMAWREATGRHPDAAWASALVRSAEHQASRWQGDYLNAVPEPDRVTLIDEFKANIDKGYNLHAVLQAWSPLSRDLSNAVLDAVNPEQLVVLATATMFHPSVFDRLETILAEQIGKPYHGPAAERLLSAMQIRKAIHTEFAP
jgi:Family of unknown function (DUF5691)